MVLSACDSLKVLIFAEKKQDVDAIHEYLLLKGVEAVSIHGGKGSFQFTRFQVYLLYLTFMHAICWRADIKGSAPLLSRVHFSCV